MVFANRVPHAFSPLAGRRGDAMGWLSIVKDRKHDVMRLPLA